MCRKRTLHSGYRILPVKRSEQREMCFQLLRYQSLELRTLMTSNTNVGKKKNIARTKQKLLITLEGSAKLNIQWGRTGVDVSFLRFQKCRCEESQIVVQERFSLQSEVPTVQCSSAGESEETLTLFRNEVPEHILRASSNQRTKMKGIQRKLQLDCQA